MSQSDFVCPYLNHPEHDSARCLICATDEQLEAAMTDPPPEEPKP